ncbi:MAG TPA: hypothetical protein VL357_03645 [Rariglobus sp.]|jgi:hypothetical protein|nr:hypothetical protein [Rariglobus sp.]
MLNKFAIDYVIFPEHSKRVRTYLTDDPVEAEEFLMHLLLGDSHIKAIRHDGVALTGHQFDRMVKIAAERIVSGLLRESLKLDVSDIKSRFGFAA